MPTGPSSFRCWSIQVGAPLAGAAVAYTLAAATAGPFITVAWPLAVGASLLLITVLLVMGQRVVEDALISAVVVVLAAMLASLNWRALLSVPLSAAVAGVLGTLANQYVIKLRGGRGAA